MRLLKYDEYGNFKVTEDLINDRPPYAILSHTWATGEQENQEITFNDLKLNIGHSRAGYSKLRFCGEQARRDGLDHFWVDTCCIDKANHTEFNEAIISMLRWYRKADRCYVYLSDVTCGQDTSDACRDTWEPAFRRSRWFTRGWTLQELLAPATIEFFSQDRVFLGTKRTLESVIHHITQIPVSALKINSHLSNYPVEERLRWAAGRSTKRPEDKAYCLLGIFDIFLPPMYGEEDNAFKRLRDEVNRSDALNPTTPANVHWTVTRQPNVMFTGRENVLRELTNLIKDFFKDPRDGNQCRVVITGVGGQGKSELCVQLAHRLRPTFWGVFWIDASSESSAKQSFLFLTRQLALPAESYQEACLSIANLKHHWMLVLDNADDPNEDYQQYMPQGPMGVVILTSRNEECQRHATAKSIALEAVSDEEAQDLLLKAARVPEHRYPDFRQDALKVGRLLSSHPLALIQAGSYVSRGHCTLAQYSEVFHQHRQRLLAFRPAQAQSHYRNVYATFEASASVLKSSLTEAARDALELLPVLATCECNRLPLCLFQAAWRVAKGISPETNYGQHDLYRQRPTSCHVARLPSLMETDRESWDPFRLMEAVQLLKAFALVSTDNSEDTTYVSMHPLVHAWARDRQTEAEQHQNWLRMGCIMTLLESDENFWTAGRWRLQRRLEALTEWKVDTIFATEPPNMIIPTLAACCYILRRMRSHMKILKFLTKVITHLGSKLTEVNEQYLVSYNLLAFTYDELGRTDEALHLWEKIVKLTEEILGEDPATRLGSPHNLADPNMHNGSTGKAVVLFEKVVQTEGQFLAENHPSLLHSQNQLAQAYKRNGQKQEAVTLLEKVVRIKDSFLPQDHESRLRSESHLARAYRANGQLEEAIKLSEKVLGIIKHLLPEGHQSLVGAQIEMAQTYQENRQVEKAIAMWEKLVRVQTQLLPEDHSSLLESQHQLATCMCEQGSYDAAIEMMTKVVQIRRRVLDHSDPDRLNSETCLSLFEIARLNAT